MERGVKSSEFWMSAITSVVAVLFPLLVAYGVLDTEKGQMWAALILAVAGVVVPIVIGSVAKNYNSGRVEVKTEAIGLETAQTQLEVLRLERLQ